MIYQQHAYNNANDTDGHDTCDHRDSNTNDSDDDADKSDLNVNMPHIVVTGMTYQKVQKLATSMGQCLKIS